MLLTWLWFQFYHRQRCQSWRMNKSVAITRSNWERFTALSINAVTGEVPIKEPIEMEKASLKWVLSQDTTLPWFKLRIKKESAHAVSYSRALEILGDLEETREKDLYKDPREIEVPDQQLPRILPKENDFICNYNYSEHWITPWHKEY